MAHIIVWWRTVVWWSQKSWINFRPWSTGWIHEHVRSASGRLVTCFNPRMIASQRLNSGSVSIHTKARTSVAWNRVVRSGGWTLSSIWCRTSVKFLRNWSMPPIWPAPRRPKSSPKGYEFRPRLYQYMAWDRTWHPNSEFKIVYNIKTDNILIYNVISQNTLTYHITC